MHATPCVRCRTPLPGQARFCTACGAPAPAGPPVPAGFVAPDQGMPVCLGCGVIAPRQGAACSICELDLPPVQARPAVAPAQDAAERYWVAVRCQFQCRVCGHLSPLNHLDMDGSVMCLRCGMSQIFDVGSWNEGLEHAHAVGDLAGPHPEGRFPGRGVSIAESNPFRDIGIDATSAASQQSAMVVKDGLMTTRSLRVEASPGQPLCTRCRAPLRVIDVTGERLSVACPACSQGAAYEIPPQATATCAGLRGVIADEHRLGNREARIERSSGGAEVIRCPNCSAALSVSGASTIVDCDYCHVSLRIPGGTLQRLGHDAPSPLVWWLLFEGRSAQRRALEGEIREAASRAHDAAAQAAAAREAIQARVQQARAGGGAQAKRKQPRPRPGIMSVIVPLVVTALVGHIGFREHVQGWIDGTDASRAAGAGGETGDSDGAAASAGDSEARPRGAAAAWAPDRSDFTPLQGCACAGKVAGARARVQLAVAMRGQPAPGDDTATTELAYFLDVGEQSYPLRSGEAGAPPVRISGRTLGIGVACRGDIVAIAAGDRVTGWSLVDGRMRWDVTLDAPYRYDSEPAAQGVAVDCARLRVRRGRVRVPRGRRGRTAIDMSSGRKRR